MPSRATSAPRARTGRSSDPRTSRMTRARGGELRHHRGTRAARRSGAPGATPPCFFDPRHGPSVRDVEWAPSDGAVRTVPACASMTPTPLVAASLLPVGRAASPGRSTARATSPRPNAAATGCDDRRTLQLRPGAGAPPRAGRARPFDRARGRIARRALRHRRSTVREFSAGVRASASANPEPPPRRSPRSHRPPSSPAPPHPPRQPLRLRSRRRPPPHWCRHPDRAPHAGA